VLVTCDPGHNAKELRCRFRVDAVVSAEAVRTLAADEARSCVLGRFGARLARAERERHGAPARSGALTIRVAALLWRTSLALGAFGPWR
jgi:hypothetical protein